MSDWPRQPSESAELPATHEQQPVMQPCERVWTSEYFHVHDRDGYFSVDYATPVVGVAAVVDGRSIVLCRVKRPILDAAPWEIPAGGIDPGESPVQGAARELAEEAGITVADHSRFQALPQYAISPRMPVLPHAYRVDLSEAEWTARGPHDHEVCEVKLFDFLTIGRMIASGELWMSETIVVLVRVLFADSQALNPPSPDR